MRGRWVMWVCPKCGKETKQRDSNLAVYCVGALKHYRKIMYKMEKKEVTVDG